MIQERTTAQNIMVKILNTLPSESGLTRIEYEGPRIALFSTNPGYFILNSNIISEMVNRVKKRIVVRTDESIRKSESECTDILMSILPSSMKISRLLFDPAVGEVTAFVKNLTVAFSLSNQDNAIISEKTGWRFTFRRLPEDFEMIEQINGILVRRSNERIRFYKEMGEKIFRPRLNERTEVSLVFLGGFNELGRSCILVTTNESNILLDCGIKLSSNDWTTSVPRFDVTGLSIDDIDCVVLSHAHLDHAGFLPTLLEYGFKGPIYCSEPTVPLTYILFKRNSQWGKNLAFVPPSATEIEDVIIHMISLPYGVVTDITPDIRMTLANAGHVLGSSITHLHFGNGDHNLIYTGDFKFGRSLALENAFWNFQRAETLVVESTLGGKEDIFQPREEVSVRLLEVINETISKGGNLLFPVPIIGQSQEIILTLNKYASMGMLPAKIFIEKAVDEASSIYESYAEYLSKEIRQVVDRPSVNIFRPPKSQIVESKRFRKGSNLIVSPSSTLTNGPSIDYLDQISDDPASTVIFTSHILPNTPARSLIEGMRDLVIDDRRISVKCKVESFPEFTAHSDYGQILAYVKRLKQKLRRVIVNHGEKNKSQNLAGSINRILRIHTQHPLVAEAIKLV